MMTAHRNMLDHVLNPFQ